MRFVTHSIQYGLLRAGIWLGSAVNDQPLYSAGW